MQRFLSIRHRRRSHSARKNDAVTATRRHSGRPQTRWPRRSSTPTPRRSALGNHHPLALGHTPQEGPRKAAHHRALLLIHGTLGGTQIPLRPRLHLHMKQSHIPVPPDQVHVATHPCVGPAPRHHLESPPLQLEVRRPLAVQARSQVGGRRRSASSSAPTGHASAPAPTPARRSTAARNLTRCRHARDHTPKRRLWREHRILSSPTSNLQPRTCNFPLPQPLIPAILKCAPHALANPEQSNHSEVADVCEIHLCNRRSCVIPRQRALAAASIGCLLEARGIKINMMKFDPYLNVDPGTMSPFQHGEVFVTDDGAETDLDLGHYERFTHAQALPRQQPHHRPHLRADHHQGAPRRLPRQDRPGHPPRHQRDQKRHAQGRRRLRGPASSRSAARSATSSPSPSSKPSARCARTSAATTPSSSTSLSSPGSPPRRS
jgi:hypothetical protein